MSKLFLLLTLVAASFQTRASLDEDFNNLCGKAIEAVGCSDIASEYAYVFGSASGAVAVAKNQGLIKSNAQCKSSIKAGAPGLEAVLKFTDMVGGGAGRMIDCVCSVNFSDQTCTGFLSDVGNEIKDGLNAVGSFIGGALKGLGCDLGLTSCGGLTSVQKRDIFISCRQFGFSYQDILNLSPFGFYDPSGKAARDFKRAAPCFVLSMMSSRALMDHSDRFYHSLIACAGHGGAALANLGEPPDAHSRTCKDGAQCAWQGGDLWKCQGGRRPPPPITAQDIYNAKVKKAKELAASLGRLCAVLAEDPLEVSCSRYDSAKSCLKSAGACKTTDGVKWDDVCCTLKGGAGAANAHIASAIRVAGQIGPSCAVNPADPYEVTCASAGTYALCMKSLPACHTSNGWNWDRSCCTLQGGGGHPSYQVRRALGVLKKINRRDCHFNQDDAIELRCRTIQSYAACKKELPAECHSSNGVTVDQACCLMGD